MWICTPFGMFMPALRPKETVPAGDSRLLQIRSRRKIDLTRLRSQYLPELGETIQLPFTDYEFRAYCTHEQWGAALARIAMDIDYVKFKEQAEKKYNDHQLHRTYTAMWSTVFRILSTKKHQNEYWGQLTKPAKSKKRKAGTSRYDWSDVFPREHDLFTATNDAILREERERQQEHEQDLIAQVPAEWESEVPTLVRMPNGNIDHSFCDHPATKGARRRCRQRNRD